MTSRKKKKERRKEEEKKKKKQTNHAAFPHELVLQRRWPSLDCERDLAKRYVD